jgi:hypothetical protein
MQNDEWFVRVQGKEYGPVDLETLREWKREGRLIGENEMRNPSETIWVKANTVADLFPEPSPVADSTVPQIRRRTFGEIVIESFRIYRQGFVPFFCLALLVAVPSFLLKICLAYVNFPEHGTPTGTAFTASAIAVVMLAVVFATWPIFLAGIQIATADLAAGRSISLREVLGGAINFWSRVAKLCLLVYGSYFIWSAIPLLAILSLVASQPSFLLLLLALGILAFQAYMTARLFVNFLFWQQSAVLAKLEGLEALRESKDLARSRREARWPERPLYRGVILASIWFLLLLALSVSAELPFLLVRLQSVTNLQDAAALVQNLANAPAPDIMTIAAYAITSLIHAALRPLLGIAFVVLYFDAKANA